MKGKVLIIGSNGFIGFRMAQLLIDRGFEVFCGISSNNRAYRVCTISAKKIILDVTKKINPNKLSDIDFVINCSTGDSKVIEEGTSNILEACLLSNIRKYIHLSSVDVFGILAGNIYEDSVTSPITEYGKNKLSSEKICSLYIKKGLDITILRPSVVYGPDSDLWVTRICKRVLEPEFTLTKNSKIGQCNLIFIDDLVNITIEALTNHNTTNKIYNISSKEKLSWLKYYEFYKSGLDPQTALKLKNHNLIAMKLYFLDLIKKIALLILEYFKSFVLNFANSNSVVKNIFKTTQKTLSINMNSNELGLITRNAFYLSHNFEEDFKYRLIYDFNKGSNISLKWYKSFFTFKK
jgi:nucleoside-diphosphate-sugar epimerase